MYIKSNILFVIHQLGVGGSERVVLNLTQKLDASRFRIFVAAFGGGDLEESFRKTCSNVFIIHKKPGLDVLTMLKLSKIIKKNEIDVVNAHHYMPLFYSFPATKILNRKRLVFTEHSVPEVESIKSSIHGKIFNMMLSQIDVVIGVSHEISNKFRTYYPRHEKKIKEVPNGVDLDRFNIKVNKIELRHRWGLTKDHFVIGMVANFRQVKNHACLVRALGRLKNDFPHLVIFFVGRGYPGFFDDTEHKIRQLVNKNGLQQKVIFSGHQKDIPEILSIFDIFCLPSFSEGMPVSILEALAVQIPVVASRARGIIEVIIHRKTGLLFDIDDDEELADLLRELIEDREQLKILVDNGYKYVAENHGADAWINECSKLFIGG